MNIFSRLARFIVPIITIARELKRFNTNFEAFMEHFGVVPPDQRPKNPEPAERPSVMITDEDAILEDEWRTEMGLLPRTRED